MLWAKVPDPLFPNDTTYHREWKYRYDADRSAGWSYWRGFFSGHFYLTQPGQESAGQSFDTYADMVEYVRLNKDVVA